MRVAWLVVAVAVSSGCASIKYGALEKIGIPKRDVLVHNVEDARDSQEEAQEEFADALQQFGSVVKLEETSLKKAYDQLNDEYEDAADAAEEVSEDIDDVEAVANALFKEWTREIDEFTDVALKRRSQEQFKVTRADYDALLATMQSAEASMDPVLRTLRDNVLFLKHNLNAQAIGSLQDTFQLLEGDIGTLIERMNQSIERSNQFIAGMEPA